MLHNEKMALSATMNVDRRCGESWRNARYAPNRSSRGPSEGAYEARLSELLLYASQG